MLTTATKLDRLLLTRAALKGVIAELESALGILDALPVTVPVLQAIAAADRAIGELGGTP